VGEVVGLYVVVWGERKRRDRDALLNFPATPGPPRDVLRRACHGRATAFEKIRGDSLSFLKAPRRFLSCCSECGRVCNGVGSLLFLLSLLSKVWRDAMTWVRAGVQSSSRATHSSDSQVTIFLCRCSCIDYVCIVSMSYDERLAGFD
jgi:hypothetical protein